jgi:hypothetical protein
MLSIENGKTYCTYIIAIPMGGVDSINTLKLYRTQVITSYRFCFCTQTKHINICVR